MAPQTGDYCMYLRKSRADMEMEARGEMETLSRHRATLAELAGRMKIDIRPDAVYQEVVSGETIAARPVMQRLLQEVEAGIWSGVFVMEVERLARGETIDQGIVAQAFRYSSTRIITPYKTYDPSDDMDEEFFEFSLFMSRREYKTIKRRLQAGRAASVKQGKYMGTRPPFGYTRVKISGDKGYTLEIVPEKAAVVRKVFDWYINGIGGTPAGSGLIARELDKMGIRTDLGNRFDAGGIRKMLQNVNYIGYVQWNQLTTQVTVRDGIRIKRREKCDQPIVVRGLHEPIINPETFEIVQRMFERHERLPVTVARCVVNPLSGLVRCGACGRMMTRGSHANAPDILQCKTVGCPCVGTYLFIVERGILDALRAWIIEYAPDVSESPEAPGAPQPDNDALVLQHMESELQTLKQQKSKLYDLLEREVYSIEVFNQRSNEIDARIASVEDSIRSFITRESSRENIIRAIIPTVKTVLAAYETADSPKQKNDLLRSVISEVAYNKPKQCSRFQNPADFMTLDVAPQLPSCHIH